jgi:hypothetical protein
MNDHRIVSTLYQLLSKLLDALTAESCNMLLNEIRSQTSTENKTGRLKFAKPP